eukprot:bmy_07386T0
MTKTNSSIFHFAIIFILILEIRTQLSDESEFLVDRSKTGLTHVPKDLSLNTTILDISQNYISELRTSDIISLSKLKILIISHNRIQYLDMSVFKFNQELEYLDLSHNKLEKISCHPTLNLKHLDLSFNAFDALPICQELGNMSQLEFLGLSATQLQKSSMLPIAYLHISKVLLVLGDTYGEKEDPESLRDLNTQSLHIVFPTRNEFHFILDVSVSTAVSLELSNIKCVLDNNGCSSFQNVLSKLQKNSRLSNLTLNNIETTWNSFIMILQLVWHTNIKYFSISNVKLQGRVDFRDFDYSGTSLKALSIHQVVNDVFSLPQGYIYKILSNMNIQHLTVSAAHMVHMVCPSQISPLLYLNFSNNLLTDMVFKNCANLVNLKTLSLQMNQLKELAIIVHMTKEMKSLQQLDVSQNSLKYDESEGNCPWTRSLLSLNMSSNILTDSVFRCLPPRVKVLDLHNNRIRSIPIDVTSLETLQELNVASNSLAHLPGCGTFSSLSILIIDYNSVSNPSADFFQSCQKIRSLKAGNNPFQCTLHSGASKLPEETELTTNCSNMSLRKVPEDLTPTTTILDLSYNLLFQLQRSDFHSFSKLKVLILCRNRIQELDIKTFEFNKELRYLDVSYNRLKSVTWFSLAGLRHLDLSFNDFDTVPICEETGNMSHLEILGLSGAKIQKSDFQKIAHLHLNTVFLGLRTLSHYEEGSLPILNTTKLHIVLPMNTNFWVLLRDGMKTSKILEITNIDGKSQFASYETQQNLILENAKTSILLLNKVDLPWDDLLLIFQFVWHTSVEYFQIQHVTFGDDVFKKSIQLPHLKTLILKDNKLETLSLSCQEVKTLNVGRNPFRCTCELRDFIQLEKYSEGLMVGWSDSYICEYPLNLKGTQLKDVHLPEISCNTALLIVTIVVIMLVLGMAVAFCYHHFDLPWYLRMLGQWTQTWHRFRKTTQEQLKRNIQFHVFISYSEHDSAWVKYELIPKVEKEDGSVLICLHEGNSDPGKSITEDTINCIEKSYKSIFVLSPNFVQTEWCHYELYFAHHNLFHECSDYIILILLEPIPLYCIPTRYPKLKTLMEKKAYLEWPKDRPSQFIGGKQALLNFAKLYFKNKHQEQTRSFPD